MSNKVKIAPSLLSCDFGKLEQEIKDVEKAGADWIHVDVMDGHFVPNITIGPLIVKAVARSAKLPTDVHLMINSPDKYIQDFADAGADIIVVHDEACSHLHRTLQKIKSCGKKAGVAFNPGTPCDSIKYVTDLLDLVLIMSVNPGFGGQKFIKSALTKITEVKELVKSADNKIEIEVDGGITPATSQAVIEAGATVLVSGSAVFGTGDYVESIRNLKVS